MPTAIDKDTILKFDVAAPRYTSYPTAPVWSPDVNESVYIEKLRQFGQSTKTLSLYIHLPFCESMCSYCACNVIIRKQEEKHGDEYLSYLFKEIDLVAAPMGKKNKVKQLHWGGGTPTFLSETQMERLVKKINQSFSLDPSAEIAIEIDPRTVNKNKIKALKRLGFNRISLGIQDFDPRVQKAVNRVQAFEEVKEIYDHCRKLHFVSINFDLIYGLPLQTTTTFQRTLDKIIELKPDRIALYSFAYVPWLKKHQNKIDKAALPTNDLKMDIFLNARRRFLSAGYQAIAMDHFALTTDELARAFNNGTLYRNFMGYTVKPADEYIGLGLTSIGFLENTFVQNHKVLNDYYGALKAGRLPIERGKILTPDDRIRQWTINSLMCQFGVSKQLFKEKFRLEFDNYFKQEQTHIGQCIEGDLLLNSPTYLQVTDLGKIFIRNVCMGFDDYLRRQKQAGTNRFSRTI